MNCYITNTSSYLPNDVVSNERMKDFMGTLEGEEATREKILRMNGIKSRYYALREDQEATHDLYELGALAAKSCLNHEESISYLSAGSTNAPLVGPGLATLLHDRLRGEVGFSRQLEINSNSGICTASAQAMINGVRAVKSGEHASALCIGVEQPSEILKSTVIRPVDDRFEHDDIRKSQWFMSVFLRSMLSDGAGAMLLSNKPLQDGMSFKVNWTYSRSFAAETPLCMKLDATSRLLSQDVGILSEYLKPCVSKLMHDAFSLHGDSLNSYKMVLPHLSSFFFRRPMLNVFREISGTRSVPFWTNLERAGNTGAASIYVMLDEFQKTQELSNGDKILLFIPESGQFNFVLASLEVVV